MRCGLGLIDVCVLCGCRYVFASKFFKSESVWIYGHFALILHRKAWFLGAGLK